jgi:F-type H+-transporting ATPase subunit delta
VREPTIARNYAAALFELGERHESTERFAGLVSGLAGAMQTEPRVKVVLESPQVPKHTKEQVLRDALHDVASDPFLRFLAAVIKRGRQGLIPQIAREYGTLVDQKLNRIHAGVTLARTPDEALKAAVVDRLKEATGKDVVARFREDPAILGGVILRIGDRIIDGSVRRRMTRLKRQLLNA